jgi:transaldolase
MSTTVPAPTQVEPPLLTMSRTTATRLWNDSADPAELTAALGWGAVGATANPVIALAALRADGPRWRERLKALAADHSTATESELGWLAVEELSVAAAALLEPAFRASGGRDGRLSIQTDPRLWRDAERLVAQAQHFDALAPNIIVKIPATSAGIVAIEEVTALGISINATVSFTVPQALAVGEAVERGMRRREAAGQDVGSMGPVCTIMVGRLDDWMKVAADKAGVTLDPGYFEWAGVAAFKRAYQIYTERGYRARLLSAAFRNHMHWSQLIGGDVVISPPFGWQKRLNASGIEAVPRIDDPVAPEVLKALLQQVAEFRRAYEPDGLSIADFDTFGATRRTLRQFLTAAADLDALVRDVLLPDPDKERTAS